MEQAQNWIPSSVGILKYEYAFILYGSKAMVLRPAQEMIVLRAIASNLEEESSAFLKARGTGNTVVTGNTVIITRGKL